MKYKIVVDSCCDMDESRKRELGIMAVPFTMRVGEKEFLDNHNLDVADFIRQKNESNKPLGSAAPSPYLYSEAIRQSGEAFVITLSRHLSCSYANAVAGKEMAEESGAGYAYVLDSKSASAGETLVTMKLHDYILSGMSREKIIASITKFADNMKTYFVLENYDNLMKSGRMGRMKVELLKLLNIKLIMGSDGDGKIALFKKARGTAQMISELMQLIYTSGRDTVGERLVISHCDNAELAQRLRSDIKKRFNFKEILIERTGGLSSLYADNKGIILAF